MAGLLDHTPGYPLGKRLSGKYDGTFGAKTLKERLPKVLTQIVDTVHRYQSTAREKHGEPGTVAVKAAVARLSELRHLLLTDKPMEPITSGEDVELWRKVFEVYRKDLGKEPHWFGVSWLFFECYMYRKVMEIIREQQLLTEFDPFREQKEKSFHDSVEQMKTTGQQLLDWTAEKHEVAEIEKQFKHFLSVCLWGNKMDLSMAATMDSYSMTHQLQEDKLRDFILADDTDHIWRFLSSPKKSGEKREIAFVLDNSGFELFSDLCLADWLLCVGVADHITLYHKQLPWFISDATRKDIDWTIQQLSSSENTTLQALGARWSEYLSTGSVRLHKHMFWTTCYEYASMEGVAPNLYHSLSSAYLVIFKGDLNYRKLVGDRNWSYTERFSTALAGFEPTNVVALRTLKADLVTGLPPGAASRAQNENKDWMIIGQYAVIQLLTL